MSSFSLFYSIIAFFVLLEYRPIFRANTSMHACVNEYVWFLYTYIIGLPFLVCIWFEPRHFGCATRSRCSIRVQAIDNYVSMKWV